MAIFTKARLGQLAKKAAERFLQGQGTKARSNPEQHDESKHSPFSIAQATNTLLAAVEPLLMTAPSICATQPPPIKTNRATNAPSLYSQLRIEKHPVLRQRKKEFAVPDLVGV